jgi:hypothetical protein
MYPFPGRLTTRSMCVAGMKPVRRQTGAKAECLPCRFAARP